jgi:hypothetical protein
MKTNKAEFEELVEKCFTELQAASQEKYDTEKAEKTAAMFLAAQMKLAFFIEDIESAARHSKAYIEKVEADKYFEIKDAATEGKKITEAALVQSVAHNTDVVNAKKANNEAEAELRKYNYLMASLKEGHIFFRGMGRKSMWNE